MRATPHRALAAITLLLTVALPISAQEEPQAEFREEMEVTEVLLDVLVTDAAGNVILGLTPGDFVVEEQGEEVDVTSVTFYSNRRFVESGLAGDRLGVSPEEIPVDRYFVLFFHDQRPEDPSLTSPFMDAVRWARKWVEEEILLNDWVAVLSYDAKLKVHQDFTTNRQQLLDALAGVSKGRDPGSNWPSRQPAVDEGPSLTRALPQGRELRRQTRRIYSALETVAEAAGSIVGRKNLMMLSMGFGELNDAGTFIPDPRYYPPMMESLNDNNVAVYAVSVIKNVADESAAQEVLASSLSLLASDTGGRAFFNFVNFQEPFRQIVEDNNGYYLVSYTSEHPRGDEGFQQVEVSVRNPEFRVRARTGYRFGPETPGS